MIKVYSPFYYKNCSHTIPGLSVPAQEFRYPRLWLLLVVCARDGVGDMGIYLMSNVMGVDCLPYAQHSSIT